MYHVENTGETQNKTFKPTKQTLCGLQLWVCWAERHKGLFNVCSCVECMVLAEDIMSGLRAEGIV